MKRCWCGNDALTDFSPDYVRCDACQTLVYSGKPAQSDPRVRNDLADFYGWDYFHGHQHGVSNYPTIETRARTDLPERCTYWLSALMHFKLPPAKLLELGSAHGGFVALLRQAGFDATGCDLSPSIVQMARETFDVPILTGPVEDQRIEPASLDVIALMDVIEHMPDPVATMRHCLSLLKDDGVMLLQTPCYPEGRSLNTMRARGDRFIQQLRPGEHLNLFSKRSIAKLFESIGAAHIAFLPPIFWFYDMFCVVSRRALTQTTDEQRAAALQTSPQQRMVLALLDGERRFRDLLEKHRELLRRAAA